jgi:orotate phosphoribosyltransferase
MDDFRQAFLAFAVARDVLRFGDFTTKAGRRTPYFFNAGLFDDGESLMRLGGFYADALVASGMAYDQLYGPAYKGIPLATATAIALAKKGRMFLGASTARKRRTTARAGASSAPG